MQTTSDSQEAALAFQPIRPRLLRVAYSMLGSLQDAEDVAQEAFIRWLNTDRSAVRDPEAFLRRTVTRLCLDQLKSARQQRETYIGPWLPEPVVQDEEVVDVTLPLLMALERLSPLERAVFLLHDVFAVAFEEIGSILEREPAACRQLASRAREHVRNARPRFPVADGQPLALARAFFDASRSGSTNELSALLAHDVTVYADGGGKRPAATQPVVGVQAVMKLHKHLATVFKDSSLLRMAYINGLPGFVTREADGHLQTTALEIAQGRIVSIYVMRNPDKLERVLMA